MEPILGVRKEIFGLTGPPEDGEKFTQNLLSPLRVFSDAPLVLLQNSASYTLLFDAPKSKASIIMLATAYPIDAKPLVNLAAVKVNAALGFTEIRYSSLSPGLCQMRLEIPEFGKAPPVGVPVPIYTETKR
jgi:hypothetical protein